jgi:uncharacterized 2Fe-2S/4Fe-4S cluster protein (DUF4445 family)
MRRSKLVKVTFEPGGTEVMVPAGILISKAAAVAGVGIESPCGGMGTCGKCRVIVNGDVSAPDSSEIRLLGEEALASGYRVACRTHANGETVVTVPDASRSRVQKILSSAAVRDCKLLSGVTKTYCELSAPSLEDETAEFERIAAFLSARDVNLRADLPVVRKISSILRRANYRVTAVTYEDELIALEEGDTTHECLGIAYDLGSTTVVGYLMDLTTGKELAVAAAMNPQMAYGDDLVSRISFATSHDDGLAILQNAAVGALNRIASQLASASGVDLNHVYRVTVVGNTCMTHLLLGIDVASLGQSPYVPAICAEMTVDARSLGLAVAEQARVTVLPNVAGFVGSDLVGVMLSNLWDDDGRTRLAVDIGTNGEMALLHKGHTYVCSAAAGPAFEGAGISCGMRGGPGAIDTVRINQRVEITTIGNRKPIGICGSGLVDAVAQMLDCGLIDESGRLLAPSEAKHLPKDIRDRVIEQDGVVRFVLAHESESGAQKPIALTHTDIRKLQLAKGSIHAAIQTLIRAAGATDHDLDEVMLAGAFGSYIKVESAIRIGLIPPVAAEKVISIGNAAGAGAKLALLCRQEMLLARKLAAKAEHLELAVSPSYQMELMERMMFPSGTAQVIED